MPIAIARSYLCLRVLHKPVYLLGAFACTVAFTPCNRFNGGLEVLKGSHRCRQPGAASGAIEFEVKPWGQAVPTPAGVQFALDQGCEAVYADLEPGDAIFCAYPLTCLSVCLIVCLIVYLSVCLRGSLTG